MIFFKIAATYTPIVLVVGTSFAYALLAIVWALALIGAGLKLLHWYPPHGMNSALYLGLGWLSVLLLWSIFDTSAAAGWCVVIGGLLYSCGVIFLLWESLKFANAIWHGFVVVASGFFFAAIWLCATV
jgi:hemolysin III